MDNTIMDNTIKGNTIKGNTIKGNTIKGKINPWDSIWVDATIKDSFILHKTDGSTLHVKKGDWIKFIGRDDVVIIDSIICQDLHNDVGPIGITYLPWRYDEQRFATPSWSIKGNSRFIICYPSGIKHYGLHIDWDKFELCSPPDNIIIEMVNEIMRS